MLYEAGSSRELFKVMKPATTLAVARCQRSKTILLSPVLIFPYPFVPAIGRFMFWIINPQIYDLAFLIAFCPSVPRTPRRWVPEVRNTRNKARRPFSLYTRQGKTVNVGLYVKKTENKQEHRAWWGFFDCA